MCTNIQELHILLLLIAFCLGGFYEVDIICGIFMSMKQLVKFILPLLILISNTVCAQSLLELSYDSKKIKEIYDIMQKVPDAPEVHLRYIKAFPNNRETFMDVFNSPQKDQLYDQSHGYVMGMQQAATSYPDQALYRCLLIANDLKAWSPGPVADLQNVIYDISLNNVDTFVVTVELFQKSSIFDIAAFLAAHTNHTINPQFNELIALLEQRNKKRLLKLFNKALRQ